jgi:hypothetical protein
MLMTIAPCPFELRRNDGSSHSDLQVFDLPICEWLKRGSQLVARPG